jgi:hypothetical protein
MVMLDLKSNIEGVLEGDANGARVIPAAWSLLIHFSSDPVISVSSKV